MKTLLIVLLGTSKRRPIKVVNETKPDIIYLVKSSQIDWKDHTVKLADELTKEIILGMAKRPEFQTAETNMIDFDSVFKTIHHIIEEFRKEPNGRMPVHIDVSATTGIAMASAILASCLYEDTHAHYIHAIFNPQSIQKAIEEENEPSKAAKQTIIEIPKPMVPIFATRESEIYKKSLVILHENNGSVPSSAVLLQKLGLDRKTKPSAAGTVSAYVRTLRRWGLVEKFHEKGNADEVKLTKFGESLARVLSKP